jgi:multicomponent Na+:H+ antiporter subunit A
MTTTILQTSTRALFHTILLFSIWMLFVGHNAPGGGFIGGLIAAAALVLRVLAYGADDLRRLVPVQAETVLGVGAALAVGTGIAGFAIEGSFLGAGMLDVHLPVLGDLHIGSVLLFDIGVYLVVVGLGLVLVRTLTGDADQTDVARPEVRS